MSEPQTAATINNERLHHLCKKELAFLVERLSKLDVQLDTWLAEKDKGTSEDLEAWLMDIYAMIKSVSMTPPGRQSTMF